MFEVNVDYKLGNKYKDEKYPIDENEKEDSNKNILHIQQVLEKLDILVGTVIINME